MPRGVPNDRPFVILCKSCRRNFTANLGRICTLCLDQRKMQETYGLKLLASGAIVDATGRRLTDQELERLQ